MANNPYQYMKDVLAAPLGEVIASVGAGVAEAQASLDAGSLNATLELYSDSEDEEGLLNLMRVIGYQPNFYAIPETKVETQISMSIASTQAISNSDTSPNLVPYHRTRLYAAPMNASNSNKYNVQTNASTKLTFSIVPVPPPSAVPEIRVVPDLVDRLWSEVEPLLQTLSINYEITDLPEGTYVATQNKDAGELISIGEVLELTLTDTVPS